MAIIRVARMGHPVLRSVSAEVTSKEIGSSWLSDFLEDMLQTMSDYDGVGLAAPQVHCSKRIVLIGSPSQERYPDAPELPTRVLINPEVTPLGAGKWEMWEGCLSVPGIRGLVRRPRQVRVRAVNEHGRRVEFTATGFQSSVIQHEVDHLDGILFPERMEDMKMFAFQREFDRYMDGAGREASPRGSKR